MGFKDGSLLKHNDDYFIISDGWLHQFDQSAIDKLGFPRNAFISVEESDLKYNEVLQPLTIVT